MHKIQKNLIEKIKGKFPYEFIENQLLINGDCLEVMDLMEDKSIDLVLTDPPYGIDVCKNPISNSNKELIQANKGKEWDCKTPSKEIFDMIFNKSLNQIIWGANHFATQLKDSSGWDVWYKSKNFSLSDVELCFTSFKKGARIFEYHTSKNNSLRQGFHMTEKPVALFLWQIEKSSKEGDLILDSFAGSFTTAVACAKTKRYSICIELDEDYYKQGVERLKRFKNYGGDCKPEDKNQVNIFDMLED